MNLTCTLKRVRFGATSDLNFFEAKNWATWRQWVNTKEWLSSIDSGPRANFNMPVSFHKHISSEKSTLMIGLGLYKFGCQNVPVSSRLLYKSCTCITSRRDRTVFSSFHLVCEPGDPMAMVQVSLLYYRHDLARNCLLQLIT